MEKSDFKNGAASPHEYYAQQDKLVREYQISLEAMGLLRKKLAKCVRTETVNQFTHCKELRERYFQLCTDRYRGMVFPVGQEPLSRNVPGLIVPTKPTDF